VHEGFLAWIKQRADGDFKQDRSTAAAALSAHQPYVSIWHAGCGAIRADQALPQYPGASASVASRTPSRLLMTYSSKVLVLEYTWSWFFQEVAENVDTETGRSELLLELVRLHNEGRTRRSESQVADHGTHGPRAFGSS